MTEPIDQPTKDLIEKEAIKYAQKVGDYTKDFHDGINAKYAYIDGAMVWAEKLRQLETQSHDQVRIIEHLEEKLKQERNKAIEAIEALEQIAYPIKHLQELADQEMSKLNGMMAIMVTNDPNYGRQIAIKALESLKDKSHE